MAGRSGRRKLEDLDLSRHELNQIGEALKQEEFRKLLVDYVKEVNDPENKKIFQSEVAQLEKERGYDVTFVNPEPGYVIKTSADDEKKAFINVCKSDKVQKPSSATGVREGSFGRNWSLPYSQAPPREDIDNSGNRCDVYDVVFHPEALEMAGWNVQFRNMLNETALDAVETNFKVKLDRKNLKFPKLKYKGLPNATVIRKKIESFKPDLEFQDYLSKLNYPFDETVKETVPRKVESKPVDTSANKSPYTTPKYIIKHRDHVDCQNFVNDRNANLNATVPKEIIVEIDLPLLSSTSEAILDVTDKSLSLVSEKPAKYKLFVTLPYIVDENSGNATFDKVKRKLHVTLPLKHTQYAPLNDFGREDSGVESDTGIRSPGSSSGEDDILESERKRSPSFGDESDHEISLVQELNGGNGNEENRTNSPVSALDNDDFRTNPSANNFLDSDKHYFFPTFTCNVLDNEIIFTLHVKNVDPSSVNHCFLENSQGIHVKFTSIGSGFFPVHHAFCSKFPFSHIDENSVNIETWDNNVVVQIQLITCDNYQSEYYAGVGDDKLVKHDLPEPTVIARKLEELKIESIEKCKQSEFNIEVTKCTKEETTVEISSKEKNEFSNLERKEKEQECLEDNSPQEISVNKKIRHPMLQKCRTLSESSGDEMGSSPSKKGILKRISRSLSESSADDYTWSSSLDMIMQSGSDSCIPEEGSQGMKKTVRFNEIVHQQTYRSNSSIFGQRKKNQRKTRNKKRAQERKASESENSEAEADKDDIEIKTEKTDDNLDEDDGNKKDDDSLENNDEDVYEVQLKLQDEKTKSANKKNNSSLVQKKGKKKVTKPVETTDSKKEDSNVDLKNDLIFQLDM